MANGVRGRDFHPQAGGTAMGGPSGNDDDGSFTSPYSANIHTHANVDEYSKDDHSIDVKHKDVYPPPPAPIPFGVAMAPGMGPFEESKKKRYDVPNGGTVIGGPSGDDEGQEFNMPITGNFHTDVSDYNKDDHSIKIKDKHVHPPPFSHPPNVVVPPPGPVIGDIGPAFREGAPRQHQNHYHVPGQAFAKRQWGPEVGGTVMGGPGGGNAPEDFPGPFVSGGTAEGGPSGEDDGIDFEAGAHADLHSNVNEYHHDDHSIDLKHTDIYPPPPPVGFGPPPFGPPFKRNWEPEPEQGGTVMGGPSGDDGGQEFNMPFTVDTHTGVHEHYEDDHSMDLKHTDVYPPPPPMPPMGGPGPFIPEGDVTPFRRAYSPSSTERTAYGGGGGTAEGGPSGEDDGINFGTPNSVDVDSNVHEHHEDNHAIKAESTDVHVPHMPWMPYHAPPAPQAVPVVEHEEAPACAPQVHEVVHTVTKTQTQVLHPTETVTKTPAEHVVQSTETIHDTHTIHDPVTVTVTQTPKEHVVQATETVYETPKQHVVEVTDTVYATPTSHVVETSAIPMSAIPNQTPASKVLYSSMATQFASIPAMPSSPVYKYSQRPMSSGAAYSMIPVQVPAATPASSSMRMPIPSGADPMHSQMASASASPSQGVMFTGGAPRLSGGIASAAAAVMGVLAFIL